MTLQKDSSQLKRKKNTFLSSVGEKLSISASCLFVCILVRVCARPCFHFYFQDVAAAHNVKLNDNTSANKSESSRIAVTCRDLNWTI